MSGRLRLFAWLTAVSARLSEMVLPSLFSRLACIAALFAAELLAFSLSIETPAIRGVGGLAGSLYLWAAPATIAIVAMATTFVTFAYLGSGEFSRPLAAGLEEAPVSKQLLALHCFAIGALCWTSILVFGAGDGQRPSDLAVVAWLSAGALSIVFAGFAFLAPRFWLQIVRRSEWTWAYAVAAGALAVAFRAYSSFLWQPSASLTFELVRFLLRPFLTDVIEDPARLIIGTNAFNVQIGPTCSGVEGVGLILIFTVLWLWIFRRSCRFPRALLLLPAGVAILWVLNGVRIALLIAIGDAGAGKMAAEGFHSQAGWIAFNAVAFGLAVTARKVSWFAVADRAKLRTTAGSSDANAAYLMPLLAMLAAGMIGHIFSARFDWAFPLQFASGALAIWLCRQEYRKIAVSPAWRPVLYGVASFAVWACLDLLLMKPGANAEAARALAAAPQPARIAWIAIRALAAVTAVPFAEELAFRAFLLRRIVSPAFRSVEPSQVTLLPILIASAASGLLYGDRWPAAAIAGLLYSLAYVRRGNIGDSLIAHTVSNAMLTAYVLLSGSWSIW